MKEMLITAGYISIAIMAFASWLIMFSGLDPSTALSSKGVRALRYFTVDSNLLMGVSALLCLFSKSFGTKVLLLAGTTAVSLTFFTVLCFLGPVLGFDKMYSGSNLYMHLIIPVLAVTMQIVSQNCTGLSFPVICWALLPTLVYALFYLRNILKKGPEYDWYCLTKGGPKTYLPVIVCFMLATFLIASCVWMASGGSSMQMRILSFSLYRSLFPG